MPHFTVDCLLLHVDSPRGTRYNPYTTLIWTFDLITLIPGPSRLLLTGVGLRLPTFDLLVVILQFTFTLYGCTIPDSVDCVFDLRYVDCGCGGYRVGPIAGLIYDLRCVTGVAAPRPRPAPLRFGAVVTRVTI